MGAINIGARNGGKVKVVAPDNPAVGTEAILPKKSGTLATLEDISSITDLDAEALVHLADQVEENKQDILELEEEIEAIAPSFDRGEWDFSQPETLPSEPLPKTYHILNEVGAVAVMYANTDKVVFSNKDAGDDVHTWADVEVGQYLEMFDERDGEFLLAKVDAIQLESNYALFEVTVQKSDGGPRGADGDDDYSHRVRVKFFTVIDEVDLSAYMPLAGGTFIGQVKHKKEIIIEPTMPNRFVTIKNRYATNADGSSAGAGGTAFGVDFDLDHGNSGYNQVKFSNRDGSILAVNGGSNPAAKYNGRMVEELHLVNKGYVDSNLLYTLHSGGNSYRYSAGSNSPADGQFATITGATTNNKEWHIKQLWNSVGASVQVKNYEATASSMFEIWENSELIVRTLIKDWKTSTRNSNCVMFNCSGYKPTVYKTTNLSEGTNYNVILTNLVKKTTSAREKIVDKIKK